MRTYFDHEKLRVYRSAIAFVVWADDLLVSLKAKAAVKDQLDRASTSVPLNLAEGNAKFSGKDRARFFGIARGSALECAACLDVLVAKRMVTESDVASGKEQLLQVISMLSGLLGDCADRMREDASTYEEAQ